MEDFPTTQPDTLANRIRERMEALGLNPFSTAKAAGVGGDYIRDILRGKVKQPSVQKLERVARALETNVLYLIGAQEDPDPITSIWDPAPTARSLNNQGRNLPIRGVLLGAVFKSTAKFTHPELGYEAGSLPPEFEGRETWYEYLQDDSQDLFIPPGSLVQVVSVPPDFFPQDGDWVVCEKTVSFTDAHGTLSAKERSLRRVERIYPDLPLLFLEFNSRSRRFKEQDDVMSIEAELEEQRQKSTPVELKPPLEPKPRIGLSDEVVKKLENLDALLNDPVAFQALVDKTKAERAKIIGKAIRFVSPLTREDTFGVEAELYFGAHPEN